jgi:hypothetical protein
MVADQRALERVGQTGRALGVVSLISDRGGRHYFRVANASGPDCYAVGPAQPVAYRLGQIICAAAFPSAAQPLLDVTVVRQTSHDPASARVNRSEGFAADGVADVALETDGGALVSVTPVVNNVYHVSVLPKEHVSRLVARDGAGKIVWSVPLGGLQLPD